MKSTTPFCKDFIKHLSKWLKTLLNYRIHQQRKILFQTHFLKTEMLARGPHVISCFCQKIEMGMQP